MCLGWLDLISTVDASILLIVSMEPRLLQKTSMVHGDLMASSETFIPSSMASWMLKKRDSPLDSDLTLVLNLSAELHE